MQRDRNWRQLLAKYGWLAIVAWLVVVLFLPAPSNEVLAKSMWILPVFGLISAIVAWRSWAGHKRSSEETVGTDKNWMSSALVKKLARFRFVRARRGLLRRLIPCEVIAFRTGDGRSAHSSITTPPAQRVST